MRAEARTSRELAPAPRAFQSMVRPAEKLNRSSFTTPTSSYVSFCLVNSTMEICMQTFLGFRENLLRRYIRMLLLSFVLILSTKRIFFRIVILYNFPNLTRKYSYFLLSPRKRARVEE